MKITKEARQLSRQLFRLSLTDNRLDRAKVTSIVDTVLTKKPRHYMGALEAYQRLLRLEIAKRHAVIESASSLSETTSASVVDSLKQKYGADLTVEFKVNPELIAGMRVRVGSDVLDGSVRSRLARSLFLLPP
jgi:F-type H+-transporting ATPase subunit delta